MVMDMRGMTTLDDDPSDFPTGGKENEKRAYLDILATEVVDRVWFAPPTEDIRLVEAGLKHCQRTKGKKRKGKGKKANEAEPDEPFPFCHCRKGDCYSSMHIGRPN